MHHSDKVFLASVWKLEGEARLRRDLAVNWFGNRISMLWARRRIVPGEVIVARIGWPLLAPRFDWMGEAAALVEVIGPSPDPEMGRLADELRARPARHDLAMGIFIRNRELGWMEGEVEWLGRKVDAMLEARLPGDLALQEKCLARLLADQAAHDGQMRTAIIAGLYALWRDDWRNEAPLLAPADFAAAMALRSITIQQEGAIELWFDDSGLFAGHEVLVRGSLGTGFEPGEIHG